MDALSGPSPPAVSKTLSYDADLFCPECGYNLRSLTSDRCPECGDYVDDLRASVSRIPWVHRDQSGWFLAYWRSAILVMFHGKRFCAEIARPVEYRHSQSFRWLTVAFAFIPVPLAVLWVYFVRVPHPFDDLLVNSLLLAIWPVFVFLGCVFLFLAAATGMPSYFFHPKRLEVATQNKAIALSYYASGSLAVTFLPVFALAMGLTSETTSRWHSGLVTGALLVIFAQWVGWWIDLMRILRRVMPNHRGKRVIALSLIPLLWCVLFVAIFGGVAFATGFIYTVVFSLS